MALEGVDLAATYDVRLQKETMMLILSIFFILGVGFGMVGLYLLARWEGHPLVRPHFDRLHRRH
jgi:hypothetical protein